MAQGECDLARCNTEMEGERDTQRMQRRMLAPSCCRRGRFPPPVTMHVHAACAQCARRVGGAHAASRGHGSCNTHAETRASEHHAEQTRMRIDLQFLADQYLINACSSREHPASCVAPLLLTAGWLSQCGGQRVRLRSRTCFRNATYVCMCSRRARARARGGGAAPATRTSAQEASATATLASKPLVADDSGSGGNSGGA